MIKGEGKLKKHLSVLMVSVFLFVLLFEVGSSAVVNEASEWAKTEVDEAIKEGLVPSNLQGDYQKDIKRYEYVLLALEILDRENTHVSIVREYPFTDILEHSYNSEIVRAYNAGIIKGYGDGTFRPDETISREEIASLIVHLIEKLNNEELTIQGQNIQYADRTSISSWAKPYIDYCYINDILKGTGKNAFGLDIINPQGKATREQSIVLLHRLSKNRGLGDREEIKGEYATELNAFAKNFGEPITQMIQDELLEDKEVTVEVMNANQMELIIHETSKLTFNDYDSFQEISVRYEKDEITSAIDYFMKATLMMNNNPNISYEIMRQKNKLESENGSFYYELSEAEAIFGQSYEENGTEYIEFRYEFTLN